MIISRFGVTWAAGYALGQIKGESEFPVTRPASIAQVGGASGAFDYFGDDNYPIAPPVVSHAFNLSAASWAAVEPALDTLRQKTICAGRTKLWALCRDNTHRWAWAKCVGLEMSEVNRSYLRVPIKASFQLTEGLWYGETQNEQTLDNLGSFYLTVAGTYPATVEATVRPLGGALTACTLTNSTNGDDWAYAGTVPDGQLLVVDSGAYKCTVNSVGAYSGLTVGSDQVCWFRLTPGGTGQNLILFTWGPVTNIRLVLKWWDTYL